MKKRTVTITLNEQSVEFQITHCDRVVLGKEIKAAAIEQGVLIQQNFVLQQELPNGTSKIIGDEDEIKLRNNLRFTAIAPDDNS